MNKILNLKNFRQILILFAILSDRASKEAVDTRVESRVG